MSGPRDTRGRRGGVEFVTAAIAGQLFGIPVLTVRDVLGPQRLTRIPLAPALVAGALNMRGRIVTAIDLRVGLGLNATDRSAQMNVVVDHGGELYSLLVDDVGEVLALEAERLAPNPPTLTPAWRDVSSGIHLLGSRLMVVLDVARLLDVERAGAIAA